MSFSIPLFNISRSFEGEIFERFQEPIPVRWSRRLEFVVVDPFYNKPPQEFRAALRWIWSVVRWGWRPLPITKIWMDADFEMRDGQLFITSNGIDFGSVPTS
jgi:hypothetical protein